MYPLDSRITVEMDFVQERKLRDILRASGVTVTGKEKDSISAALVVWLVENRYIPGFRDHVYYEACPSRLEYEMLQPPDLPLGAIRT
jgi:hypothetical protein